MSRATLKNVMSLLSEANNEVPTATSFITNLKRSIELTEKKNARKPSPTYKPSGMHCIRSMYYAVTEAEVEAEDVSYILTGICNSGTDIHVRIQNAVMDMQSNGIDCEYIDVAEFVKSRNLDYLVIREQNASNTETKLYYPDLNLSFMCDGIIKYKGKYYIIEFKTETAYKFGSRTDVDPKHHHQATAYSIAFQLPTVIFVYICRDNLDMKCYEFTPTEQMKSDLISLIKTCDEYAEKKTAPPIPDDITNKVCQYCSYKKLCKGED